MDKTEQDNYANLVTASHMVTIPCTCHNKKSLNPETRCPRCSLVFQIAELLENRDLWMQLSIRLYQAIQSKDLEQFKSIVEAMNQHIDQLTGEKPQ